MPRGRKSRGAPAHGARALYGDWAELHRSRPPLLYHYTTAAGLLSMLKSGHVWASESRYMNDPREFLHGAGVILEVIERLAKRRNPPQALLEIKAAVQAHVEEKLRNVRIFCMSFCTNGDLLSQWRGYGDTGGGYALGFQPRYLFGRSQTERGPL